VPHGLRLSHSIPSRCAIIILNSDARFTPFRDGIPNLNPD
jgi:hypothetical protein